MREKLKHFVSKDALNIEGLGKKGIDNFWKEKLIKYSYNIFNLDVNILKKFDGIYIFLYCVPFTNIFFERLIIKFARKTIYDIDDLVFLLKTSKEINKLEKELTLSHANACKLITEKNKNIQKT